MMFTPCGPRAVPTGGAGVALPAGVWHLNCPVTFFAMCDPLCLFYLQEVEFNGSCTAKDGHHDAQSVALTVDVIDFPGEVCERSIDDADVLVLLECKLRTRTLGRGLLAVEDG